jgi:hypothetical protein
VILDKSNAAAPFGSVGTMQIAISEQIRNSGVKTKTPLTEAAFFYLP